MLRRLYHDQPDNFAFTPENQAWAEAQITKYPEGRQASAVIPLLWRAQEQEGWVTRKIIETVGDMLGMAHIRVLEVATFYFMFQLQPVGSVAHIQVCGTTSCMICGAEDLIRVCRENISPKPYQLSEDGKLSWEEVECLGACANAPMAQIGKDYYEDLTTESFAQLIKDLGKGEVPVPGPQNGRYASEPSNGLTSLSGHLEGRDPHNASVGRAVSLADTVKRIDGSEVPLTTPWLNRDIPQGAEAEVAEEASAGGGTTIVARQPRALAGPEGDADDLKRINGVGPKLSSVLNGLGIFHFHQIADWTPEEVLWMDTELTGFKGRASRDTWVEQVKTLMDVDAKSSVDNSEETG